MDAEAIAKQARKSIGRFCIEECKAYCCRKGYLILKPGQLDLVTQGNKAILAHILKQLSNGDYSMYMGSPGLPCPSLNSDFTCKIHKKRNRPQACKDFPLFIKGNLIILSSRCLAVKQNLFYPFIRRLQLLGYKLVVQEDVPFDLYSEERIDFTRGEPKIAKTSA